MKEIRKRGHEKEYVMRGRDGGDRIGKGGRDEGDEIRGMDRIKEIESRSSGTSVG